MQDPTQGRDKTCGRRAGKLTKGVDKPSGEAPGRYYSGAAQPRSRRNVASQETPRKYPGGMEEDCSDKDAEHFQGRDLVVRTAPEEKKESGTKETRQGEEDTGPDPRPRRDMWREGEQKNRPRE
ncbi:hypothetical protein NDU88_001542 [Pleurodeles waltl]|uniref:Uncharacterized protein n=1 Tax=Pleurodeles waltl TaxID=8319 RepID=A0AAV7S7N6_PLEWA|nr:hypothetical protein NDU88_001542 [Pleurodeles waltl]